MPRILEVNGLRAGYGMFSVLHDVSFQVDEGEMVALIGSNGAGKTTTLRCVCGLIPSKSGTIAFRGQEYRAPVTHELVAAGLVCVPEGRELFPGLSVKDALLVGGANKRARGSRKKNLQQVYDLFPKLRDRQSQLCSTLSGGEQQMVAIGRALMAMPSLLLLDEPSLGLAPTIVKQLFETISLIREQGVSILLVEQNVRTVLRIADRAYVMENGSIEMEGSAEVLANDPTVVDAYFGVGSKESV